MSQLDAIAPHYAMAARRWGTIANAKVEMPVATKNVAITATQHIAKLVDQIHADIFEYRELARYRDILFPGRRTAASFLARASSTFKIRMHPGDRKQHSRKKKRGNAFGTARKEPFRSRASKGNIGQM